MIPTPVALEIPPRLHPLGSTTSERLWAQVSVVWSFGCGVFLLVVVYFLFFFASEQIRSFLYFLVVKSQRNWLVIRKRDAGCGHREAGMLQEPRHGIKAPGTVCSHGSCKFLAPVCKALPWSQGYGATASWRQVSKAGMATVRRIGFLITVHFVN